MFGFTPCSIEREVLLLVYPSSVAQIVHSVTLEVVLLSVSSSLADIVGLFYGRRKNGDTGNNAQLMPIYGIRYEKGGRGSREGEMKWTMGYQGSAFSH